VRGNETSGNGRWQGTFRLVAIHNRVLTPAQSVIQNLVVHLGRSLPRTRATEAPMNIEMA